MASSTDAHIRLQTHHNIETRKAGAHTLDLDTPSISQHVDNHAPEINISNGKLAIFHGHTFQSWLPKSSALRTDDIVLHASGHIKLSDDAVALYKALSRALDAKLFRFTGDFDCPNAYVQHGMACGAYKTLAKLTGDALLPYYFVHTSPIRGRVTHRKTLSAQNEGVTRELFVVKVEKTGDLRRVIPDRTVVYLGGDHALRAPHGETVSPSQLRLADGDPVRKKDSKFVRYKYSVSVARPDVDDASRLVIASPFCNTWQGTADSGVNVGLAKFRNGQFIYWATSFPPASGHQVSKLPFGEISYSPFWHGQEQLKTWPPNEGEEDKPLQDIFEGAYVMRGDRLVQAVEEEDYPSGVLDRLRGGFFRVANVEMATHLSRITLQIEKGKRSIKKYGAKLFGFQASKNGVVECDIETLGTFLTIPGDVLLAYIAQFLSSYVYFRGTVSFMGCKEMQGMFEITKAVKVGPWMRGSFQDTGAGLLYGIWVGKYFRVETKEGVSWVSEYVGPGINEGNPLELAPFISAAKA